MLRELETAVLSEPIPAKVVVTEAVRPKTPKEWTLRESVFGPRARECDARDFLDTEKVFAKMFELDWNRLQEKRTFVKYCPGDRPSGQAVKQVVQRYYAKLSRAYAYYSVLGSGTEDSMQLNEYTELCHDIDIPDKASKHCKLKDIDGIFITAAFKDAEEGKRLGLDKKSLGRHEFIEAFIRMSEVGGPALPRPKFFFFPSFFRCPLLSHFEWVTNPLQNKLSG